MLEQKSRLVFVKAVGAHLCYHSHNERKTPQVCFDLRNYEILDLNMKNPMFFKPSCYNQTEQKYVKHDFGKRFLINSD